MKRFLTILTAVILIACSLVPASVQAEELTHVTIRCIMPGIITFSTGYIEVYQLDNSGNINIESYQKKTVFATDDGEAGWSVSFDLVPGTYNFDFMPDDWDYSDVANLEKFLSGLERHNVKVEGDKMVIYFVAETEKYPAPAHPEDPVIYGDDTKGVWIWEETTEPPVVTGEPLPTYDTDVVPVEPPVTGEPYVPGTTPEKTEPHQQHQSQNIGTIIFIVIVIVGLAASFIILYRKKKARGE